jgi:rhodanese-related sulfurtransferase
MDYVSQTRRNIRVRRTWLLFTALIAMGLTLPSCRSVEWFVVKRSLRNKFRDEHWITTRQLADWLADKQLPAPILLDVRTSAEWKVSHLPGARRVEPGASAAVAAGDIGRDVPIVTYCAVGYRSGEMAQRLRKAGYTNVQNLEGSIFEWANEHRPLVHDGRLASQVHPYDASRGRLLSDDVRAPLPPNEAPNDSELRSR